MEAMHSSEMLITTYRSRQHHNPEDHSKALLRNLQTVKELATRIINTAMFLDMKAS
jgi:hypothetical protein